MKLLCYIANSYHAILTCIIVFLTFIFLCDVTEGWRYMVISLTNVHFFSALLLFVG